MVNENFSEPQKEEPFDNKTSIDYHAVPIHPGALRRMLQDLQYLFSVLPKKGAYENFRHIQKEIQEKSKNEASQLNEINVQEKYISPEEIPRDTQTFRIANSAIKLLNFYYTEVSPSNDISPKKRKQEMDEKGNLLFYIEHPVQVATLCFLNLPLEESEFKNITETEKIILTEALSKPYELAVTAFFHDFVEDIFDGEFDVEHPITKRTARQEIVNFLRDPKHDIPLDAQERILNRINVLTKPPSRYSSKNCEEKTECYLKHYESYLQQIIDSDDPLCQYIKLIDILQNAQSQKQDDPKRKGKARLQSDFIQKLFPSFITKLLTEKPQFFDDMSDRNLVEGLQKIAELQKNIQNKVNNTLKEE